MGYIGKDTAYYESYAEMTKMNAQYEQREKLNKLLEEQNTLLKNNINNTSYNYDYYNSYTGEETSFLGLLSILSIVPVALGFIMVFLIPKDDISMSTGVKLIVGGLIAPTLNTIKNIFKKIIDK